MAGVIDWSQDFEGTLGDSTAVTTSNLTGNQFHAVSIGSGNAAEIDTARAAAGSRSLRLAKGGANRTQLYANVGAGDTTASFRAAVYMVARPSGATETLLRAFNDGTTHAANKFDIIITNTGRIQITDAGTATSASSSVGLNAAAWYWIEGFYNSATTTMTVRAYLLTSATLFTSVSLSTMGVYTVDEWALGEISTNTSALDVNVDQVAFGHSDYLARTDITDVPPVVLAQADKASAAGSPATVTATATSTSPATVSSVTASCISTTAPGVSAGSLAFTTTYLSGSGTASVSVSVTSTTSLDTGTYVIRFTVTDSNALTSTDDGTVFVDTGTAYPESVITSGGGTVTGAADVVAATRDASDTGYVVFTTPTGTVAEWQVSPTRVGGAVVVTVRAQLTSGTGDVLIELFEGATNRTPGRSAQAITTSWADYTVTLTGPEVTGVVDWANLRVRMTMTAT